MKTFSKKLLALLKAFGETVLTLVYVAVFSRKTNASWRRRPVATAVVLGNGPSLREDLGLLAEKNKGEKVELWAVNNFCLSSEFSTLQPSFYVLADPNYWLASVSEEVEVSRNCFAKRLQSCLTWPMTLLVPRAGQNSEFLNQLRTPFLNIEFYNSTPLAGFLPVSHKLMDKQLAMPAALNVLLATISLALFANYTRIVVLGADHSWHENLVVSRSGAALVEQHHFYVEMVEPKPVYRPNQDFFTVGDLFVRWGRVFQGYEFLEKYSVRKGVEIINASSKSYIDAFCRKKLSDLAL